MNPVLLFLLLPLEFMQPVETTQHFLLYENLQPTAHVALMPEDAAASPVDSGVFRLTIQPMDLDEQQESPATGDGEAVDTAVEFDFFSSDSELLIEQSRRRSSVYTVHSPGAVPTIVDMTEIAGQIPHNLTAGFGVAGDTLELSEQSGVYLDFFPGMVIIRRPSDGLMLVWTQNNTQDQL